MSSVVKVFDKTAKVIAAFHTSAQKAVIKACYDTEAQAKQNIIEVDAVDTGNMLNSTQADLSDIANGVGIVSVGAEYGPDVEYGHHTRSGSYIQGRPFFTPAVEKVRPLFVQYCRSSLEIELK